MVAGWTRSPSRHSTTTFRPTLLPDLANGGMLNGTFSIGNGAAPPVLYGSGTNLGAVTAREDAVCLAHRLPEAKPALVVVL
ncbi:MAG: hypothetical protein J2P57_14770 [Acidimicrobiaceae bacterium]|nr:hypothetical protein [Acidimicrobiaceae bacterium]